MSTHDDRLSDLSPAEVALPPPRMTEEQFLAWCQADEENRAEWVDGEVIMMSPANFDHAELVAWLTTILRIYVEQNGLGKVVGDVFVRFAARRSRRVPDLLFVAKNHLDRLRKTHVEGPPDLIIEIVSPDSESRDWREKYIEYQAEGVREYWVIDPASEHVEIYALGAAGGMAEPPEAAAEYHRLPEKDGVIESAVLTGFRLQTAWLWPATRPKALEALRELGVL